MCSQKPPLQKITLTKGEEFEKLVSDSGLVVPGAWAWRDGVASDGEVLAQEFERHWKDILGEHEGAQELLQAIPRFVEESPTIDTKWKEAATYIEDVKTFKASLQTSERSEFCHWAALRTRALF
jgi:hypothetical protein